MAREENALIDSLLLAAARICTFEQRRLLSNASGFFFERDERLFLVTSRHVVMDAGSHHLPDSLEIELHSDPENMAKSTGVSIPLYRNGKPSGGRASTLPERSMLRQSRLTAPPCQSRRSITLLIPPIY